MKARQRLGMAPVQPEVQRPQGAYHAFLYASSYEELRAAVAQHPIMVEPYFIRSLQEYIAELVSEEARPALEQRLAWLSQIAGSLRWR